MRDLTVTVRNRASFLYVLQAVPPKGAYPHTHTLMLIVHFSIAPSEDTHKQVGLRAINRYLLLEIISSDGKVPRNLPLLSCTTWAAHVCMRWWCACSRGLLSLVTRHDTIGNRWEITNSRLSHLNFYTYRTPWATEAGCYWCRECPR